MGWVLTGRLLWGAADSRGAVGEVAGGCRVVEALQVVGGAVHGGHAVAPVGAVGHLRVAMAQDGGVGVGLRGGASGGGKEEDGRRDLHPGGGPGEWPGEWRRGRRA